MSVYREPARRRARAALIGALVGLLAGGIVGFLLGRATEGEPTLAEQAGQLEERLAPALNALELVTIEYPEAVRDGEVVAPTEYEAARSQAQTAADVVASTGEDLAVLSAADARRAETLTRRLTDLIERRETPEAVARLARDAADAVTSAARLEAGAPS
jgi:hypothetical protein